MLGPSAKWAPSHSEEGGMEEKGGGGGDGRGRGGMRNDAT